MTRPPPEGLPSHAMPLNPETARIVLRMDDTICAFRLGERSGVSAVDSAIGLLFDFTDDEVLNEAVRRAERPRVPRRPDRVELSILTALADTYGSEMLSNASLGYVLRLVARHGGIALVQRVLWGESAADRQLAAMLGAVRVSFEEVVNVFSDALLAQAHNVLAGFRPRPPGGPKSGQGGRG